MKAKYIFKGLVAALLLVFITGSCDSYNEAVIEDLNVSREFSPIGLTARIRNQTTVELNWTLKEEDAAHYVIEFSADDPEFKTIFKTVEVTADQLPVQVALEGETVYSIRVKSVSSTGLADSKWSVTTATTLSEQIFLPVQDADIDATQITLRWTPNSTVTQITVAPGDIIHTITPEEKTTGVAIITGLTGETTYTATLLNGVKKRGVVTFKTGIDIGTGILVKPEDDLNAVIAAAPAGSVLVLMPGDYTKYTGEILLDKPITIRGLRIADKPKLHVKFTLSATATSLSLIDLELNGDKTLSEVVKYNQSGTYGKLLISGCIVHDYTGSLVYAPSTSSARIESVTVENSICTNMVTGSSGEFIDFRASYVGNINVTKSTFNNVAASRGFIRADATATFGAGLTSSLIDSCTFYGVTNTIANNAYVIFYVRFATNAAIVRNSLFVETAARYTSQATTIAPTFSNNNYYNAATLNAAVSTAAVKSDPAGTALNPQFANAANGDFTVGNQNIKDNGIGDPRWIK
ncbi:DUF5123 domain-containing protein [Pseudomonas shirazensis]